jgi:hypothetical protein
MEEEISGGGSGAYKVPVVRTNITISVGPGKSAKKDQTTVCSNQ